MVSLPGADIIQSLVVHGTAGRAIVLGCDVHPALPGHRGVQGDLLNDAQAYVTLQHLLYSLFPVDGDYCRAVDSNRLGTGVDMEL